MPIARVALALAVVVISHAVDAAPVDAGALDQGSDIAYRRQLQAAAGERRLNADRAALARIRGIAHRIVVGTPTLDGNPRLSTPMVNVIADPAIDVPGYPGGRLIVHTGVLAAGLADEEIGALLAHVLAHALLGHDERRIEQAVSAADAAAPDPNQRALAVAKAANDLLKRRYESAEIAAADSAGVDLLARAGYPPAAAAAAWRRLPADTPLALRFPVTSARIAELEAAAQHAQPLFEEAQAKAAAAPPPERRAPPPASRPRR